MELVAMDVASFLFVDAILNTNELISDPVFILGLILIGLMVGIAIGLSGLGGAPLLLPSLVVIGVPPQLVIGADLAFIFGTKLFASILHSRENNVNWHALVFLLLPVVPVMLFGSWVWTDIKDNYGSEALDTVILLLLGFILVGVSTYMIKSNVLREDRMGGKETNKSIPHKFLKSEKITFLGAGSVISFITQITATGAGAMTLPLLIKKCHCPPKHVAGTSVIFGVAVSSVGTILHYNMGNVPVLMVLILLVGSIPGVFLGVRFASKISPKKLIAAFGMIILAAAAFLISKGIGII